MRHGDKSSNSLHPGSLVMYEHQGTALLGIILSEKKNCFEVLNQRGRRLDLRSNRMHLLPPTDEEDGATDTERAQRLEQLELHCREKAAHVDLEELWTFFRQESQSYTVSELCAGYFGADTLENHLSLRYALLDDRLFFKRRKERFEARSADALDTLRKQLEVEDARNEVYREFLTACTARLKDPELEFPQSSLPVLEKLEIVAADGKLHSNQAHREVKKLIEELCQELNLSSRGNQRELAFRILEAVGHFTRNTNLAVFRNQPHILFSGPALEQASTIQGLTSSKLQREDFTGAHTVTIDDATTLDMDDALSIEQTGTGFRLGIHISDIASAIPIDSPLDYETRKRATSIYLPDQTINMFPDELANTAFSLCSGEVKNCLSCIFELDSHYSVLSRRVIATQISVNEKISYPEADRRLSEHDAFLSRLFQAAASYEAERLAHGGFKVHKRIAAPEIADDGSVRIVEINEQAPSRNLIGELMILANSSFASYCLEHSLPAIYRSQQPPDADRTIDPDIPDGPARDYRERTQLKRSLTSTKPLPHSTLGLEHYLQATSPIRRYLDLVNQRQIAAGLLGETTPYDPDALEDLINEVHAPLKLAGTTTKESKRFWLIRYLEQTIGSKGSIRGTVLRTDLKTPLVELDTVFMPLLTKLPRDAKPGDVYEFKISASDARYDYLKLEIA